MGNQHRQKPVVDRHQQRRPEVSDHNADSGEPKPGFMLSPAAIMKLQRTIGNQAVQRLIAQNKPSQGSPAKVHSNRQNIRVTTPAIDQSGTTVQKQPNRKKTNPKIKWSEVISQLTEVKQTSTDRLVSAQTYMEEGLKTADGTKAKLDNAAARYEEAYDKYESVINKAKKKASSKESLIDTFVSIGVGVTLGVISTAMLPATATIGVRVAVELLTEGGEAALGSAIGKLTDQNVDSLKPTGMHPMALRAKHYKELVELYRGLALTGKDALAQALLLTRISDLIGQARLLDAGAKADMKPEDIVNQANKLKTMVKPIFYPLGDVQSLKQELSKRMVPSVRELEQYLWVQWIASFGHYDENLDRFVFGNTDVLDNDTIEDYLHGDIDILGSNSLLGVDFGWYTSEDDEEDAVVAADDKWGEILNKHKDVL